VICRIDNPYVKRKQLEFRRWCFLIFLLAVISFFCLLVFRLDGFWHVILFFAACLVVFTFLKVVYCGIFGPIITPLMIQRCFQQFNGANRKIKMEWHSVPIEKISPYLINLVDLGESMSMFVYDRGFLFKSLTRAFNINQSSSVLVGGSTISQQTAKNCFLPHHRNMLRKVIEAYYVILIELLWGKKRIMECYLNIIEFGDGIYGCEAASQHYFHHSVADLTVEEAALLVGSLPWPRSANPDKHTPYYDSYVESLLDRFPNHETIDWSAKIENLNMDKVIEGNKGLGLFIKWCCFNKYKELKNKIIHGKA